ncbi:MAG: hypothetical protein HYU64_13590 [Armatimonadetes bacterium]|nr:hypothetical protein [Armatimonadota bacterium]
MLKEITQLTLPAFSQIEASRKDGDGLVVVKTADNPMSPETEQLLLSAQIAGLAAKMRGGDKVTITLGGEKTLEVTKESRDGWKAFKTQLRDVAKTAARTTSDLVQQDPVFVFSQSVFAVKDQAMRYVPAPLKTQAEQLIVPALRGVALALNAKKAISTTQNRAADRLDKGVDIGHVVTDVIGLAGGIMGFIPAMAANAPIIAAVGVVGDILAFGYHAMDFLKDAPDQHLPGADSTEERGQTK